MHIILAAKIIVLLATVIAIFSQDLTILFNDALFSEITNYLFAVPFFFAYLIYRKRRMLRAVIPIENKDQPEETRHLPMLAGILLSITAILLYWHGSHTFTPLEYHMLALPIFAAGLCLIMFNQQTLRQVIFPIAFLAFLIPPPAEVLYTIGSTLSVMSCNASNSILNAFGISSAIVSEYGNPTIVITRPNGTILPFTVDTACSGIYSLISFLIFVAFVAYIVRDKLWKKLTLALLGIPLIYMLNIARITTILLIGYYYSNETALQIFHLLGGWILVFLGTLALLVISGKIFKTRIFSNPKEECSVCISENSSNQSFCHACGRILKPEKIAFHKSDILKIGAIIIAVVLLMTIQVPVFALTKVSPIVTTYTPSGQIVSTSILPPVANYSLSFESRDREFEAAYQEDMALLYLYSPLDPLDTSMRSLWVSIDMAPTQWSLHRWETCLITWPLSQGQQPKANEIELEDIQLTSNPPIIGRYFVFKDTLTNQTQAVLYWYESSTFMVNSTSKQEQIRISLIAYPENMQELPNIKNQLLTLATRINDYWEPIKTWSLIAMLISENAANIAIVANILVIAIIILYLVETRGQRKANSVAFQKLSEPNKQIIDAVRKTERNSMPTLASISSISKETSQSKLLEKLYELEKTGLVKRLIASRDDEPTQIWKTQIVWDRGKSHD
jgi:exosortase